MHEITYIHMYILTFAPHHMQFLAVTPLIADVAITGKHTDESIILCVRMCVCVCLPVNISMAECQICCWQFIKSKCCHDQCGFGVNKSQSNTLTAANLSSGGVYIYIMYLCTLCYALFRLHNYENTSTHVRIRPNICVECLRHVGKPKIVSLANMSIYELIQTYTRLNMYANHNEVIMG